MTRNIKKKSYLCRLKMINPKSNHNGYNTIIDPKD